MTGPEDREPVTIRRSRRFGMVFADVLSDPRLAPLTRLVYAGLTVHADTDRAANPSIASLATMLGIGRTTVYTALRELEEAGWLTRDPVITKLGQRPNAYTLSDVPQAVRPTDPPRPGGGPPGGPGGGPPAVRDTDPPRPRGGPPGGPRGGPPDLTEIDPHTRARAREDSQPALSPADRHPSARRVCPRCRHVHAVLLDGSLEPCIRRQPPAVAAAGVAAARAALAHAQHHPYAPDPAGRHPACLTCGLPEANRRHTPGAPPVVAGSQPKSAAKEVPA